MLPPIRLFYISLNKLSCRKSSIILCNTTALRYDLCHYLNKHGTTISGFNYSYQLRVSLYYKFAVLIMLICIRTMCVYCKQNFDTTQ